MHSPAHRSNRQVCVALAADINELIGEVDLSPLDPAGLDHHRARRRGRHMFQKTSR
jgi:hypothetical protein